MSASCSNELDDWFSNCLGKMDSLLDCDGDAYLGKVRTLLARHF